MQIQNRIFIFLRCRFGFDVPVILRSSDETESVLPVPEKRMVQVTNPFALEIGSDVASVTGRNWFCTLLPIF